MKITPPFLCCFLGLGLGVNPAFADAVRVQITGPDGKPVAGAQVRVIESSGTWNNRKVEAPLELSSDEAGKFAFESKNSLAKKPENGPLESNNYVFARIIGAGMAIEAQPLKAGDNQISLKAGGSWGGVALDENQKPVAGVKIILSGFGAEGEAKATYLSKELQLETTTGEDGKWSFSGVPRVGTARISVQDPRFAREDLSLPLGEAGAPPLFLERGATLKGRLLTPDGTGAADVPLFTVNRGGNNFGIEEFRTAPDGTFSIASLQAGTYYLQNRNFGGLKSLPFIMEAKNVETLQAGETRDLGDWKTQIGTLVKGKAVESGTGKPVPDASASFWGRGNGRGTSNENGEFSFRIGDDVSQGSVSAGGFVSLPKTLPAAVDGVIDLGTVELKRGIEARGVIKDKEGRAAGQMQFYAEGKRNSREYAMSGEDGSFVFAGLAPDTYTLKSEGRKFASGATFTIAEGQKVAPIEAVLEAEVAADTPKTLIGRALDGAGKPVAGAKITLRISDSNRSSQTIRTVSGVDGRFETKFSLPGATPKIAKAMRPGLVFARADDFKVVDGVWRADISFRERGAALRGKIVDSEGKPAARAYVALAGRNDNPIVQSDESGAFSIPDVALEGITLLASDGRGYSETTIEKASENTRIALQKSADYDAATLADEILPDARLGNLWGERWASTWEALGTQRMEAAVLRAKTGGRNNSWDWTWNEYLRQLARRDPKSFLARGDELVALATQNGAEAATTLATLRARSEDPADREKARVWLETQSQEKRPLNENSVSALLRLGVVAEALGAGAGAKWVDFAAQIAAQLSDKGRASSANEWGKSAALIGPQALEDLLLEWGGNAQLSAYGGALQAFVEAGNLESARAMLAKMEATLPAAQKAQDQIVVETYVQKPKDIVAQARGEFAALLAKTDPKAAFAMAKDVSEYRSSELLLIIGKNAARLGQTELAAQALRQVFEAKYSNVEPGAGAAQIALGFDPKLADELFLKAWQKAKPRENESDFGYKPSIAAYAGARAKDWAGESRILIEREWAERIKAYKPPADNDYDSNSESLKALIGAMAKIDARRALEMAQALPGKDEDKAQARGQIAIALLGKD